MAKGKDEKIPLPQMTWFNSPGHVRSSFKNQSEVPGRLSHTAILNLNLTLTPASGDVLIPYHDFILRGCCANFVTVYMCLYLVAVPTL